MARHHKNKITDTQKTMIDFLPLLIAVISLGGSAITFILTAKQRKATATRDVTESFRLLVESLQAELEAEREKRRTQIAELKDDAATEKVHRELLEKQIAVEREARIKAEMRVTELGDRVSALENENAELKAENARLRKN